MSDTLQLYQSQRELVASGELSMPVVIGTLGMNQDGTVKTNCKDRTDTIAAHLKLIGNLDEIERYRASILLPERFLLANWSPELNAAFIDGAILANRQVLLVTRILNYTKYCHDTRELPVDPAIFTQSTFWELFALHSFGYKFNTDNSSVVTCIPPDRLLKKYEYTEDLREFFKDNAAMVLLVPKGSLTKGYLEDLDRNGKLILEKYPSITRFLEILKDLELRQTAAVAKKSEPVVFTGSAPGLSTGKKWVAAGKKVEVCQPAVLKEPEVLPSDEGVAAKQKFVARGPKINIK